MNKSQTLLHLALNEAVSESEGRRGESIRYGGLGALVVVVRHAALERSQVVLLHVRVAEDDGEPLVVRDVLHLGAQNFP